MKKRTTLTPLLFSTFTCLVIAGCQKEKLAPPKETFPIEYRFLNEGDENVRAVNFKIFTVFTDDSTDKKGNAYSTVQWLSSAINEVPVNGPVKIFGAKPGYASCIGHLKLRVVFTEPVFSPFYEAEGIAGGSNLYNGWTYVRTFVGDTITIQSASDAVLEFKWPSDTAKYKEVRFL